MLDSAKTFDNTSSDVIAKLVRVASNSKIVSHTEVSASMCHLQRLNYLPPQQALSMGFNS